MTRIAFGSFSSSRFCMVSEEKKRGKFDMYFLSNDFRELCSYLIMFFYSAIFKKRKLFKRAYICIYLMYSFFFLSIRRVDTACKRLRKKQRKGIEISLTKDNFFASSRLSSRQPLFDHHPFFCNINFHRKIVFLIFYFIHRRSKEKKKKRKIRL